MNERRGTTMICVLLGMLSTGAAHTMARQQAPAPAPATPVSTAPSGDADPKPQAGEADERDARDLERRPREAPLVRPIAGARAPMPGSGSSVLRPGVGSLVREGAFLRERRGRLLVGPDGAWTYVFDADESGKAEPPMVVQPSRRLEEMKHIVENRPGTTTFLVTGQVFVYGGQNYLLPTFFSSMAVEPAVAAPAPANAATSEKPAASGAEELLREMGAGQGREQADRKPARPNRIEDRRSEAGAGAPPRLLREGLMIASRRGRVHRSISGEWIFTTDNNAQSRGGEPPLVLLPCLNLEGIEALQRIEGERVSISISGMVLVYNERNYLLTTMYRIEPDVDGNIAAAP